MKETGEKTDSVLLRKLVDEALATRLKKSQSLPLIEEPESESGGRLEAIESLLMRLVRQGDTSFASRMCCWCFCKTPLLRLMRHTKFMGVSGYASSSR